MTEVEEAQPAIVHTDPRSHGDRTPIVLDCEYALLGALLRSDTVEEAATLLGAVADEDFADPWVRRAVALARRVVHDGDLPAASVLLGRLITEQGRHQYQLMAVLLVDAWWAGPPPIVAWPLVVAVLEASYRRAARCWADRVRQASDGPVDVLTEVLADYAPMRAAFRRLTKARRTTWRLRATGSTAQRATVRRTGDATSLGSPARLNPTRAKRVCRPRPVTSPGSQSRLRATHVVAVPPQSEHTRPRRHHPERLEGGPSWPS